MKLESPAFDLFPRDVAVPNRQKPVAVSVHPKRDESMLQHLDTREQQSNPMHHMLPPNLAMVPQVLFELLELREYIRIVPARLRSDLLVQDKLPRTHAHAPAIRRQRGSASPGRSGPPVKPNRHTRYHRAFGQRPPLARTVAHRVDRLMSQQCSTWNVSLGLGKQLCEINRLRYRPKRPSHRKAGRFDPQESGKPNA